MKRIYHVLINPISGCGSGEKFGKIITELLEKNQFTYYKYETTHPNHELEIVQSLLDNKQLNSFPKDRTLLPEEQFPVLLVIGGDGTLHHVVNQLHAYDAKYPVAYIAAGKGNDFARSLGILMDPTDRFWQIIETRKPRVVPLIQYRDGIQGDQQVFFNNFGIGVDAKIQEKLTMSMNKRKNPTFSRWDHFKAALFALIQQKPLPIRIEWNGQTRQFNKAKLCTITNHPYFGGGVAISSNTELTKKSFELVLIEKLPLHKSTALLYRILRKQALDSPNFHRYSLKKVRMTTTSLEDTQIDGEPLGKRCFDVTFSITEQSFW